MNAENRYIKILFKGLMIPPDKIPLIVSNTVLAGYFFGKKGLAMVTLLMPIYFFFETIGLWINYGAFNKSIEEIAKNETLKARSYSKLSLMTSIVLGVIISILVIIFNQELMTYLLITDKEFTQNYLIIMAISGIFLIIASYCWQFVKMIGLQSLIKKIYIPIMIVDIIVSSLCVKVFSLGLESLAIGMLISNIFVIVISGSTLKKSFKGNLLGEIQNPIESLKEIILSGSAVCLEKFYSLIQMFFINSILITSLSTEAVAVFGSMQTAIRICRLHSQVCWQPLVPVLIMEYVNKNVKLMKKFFNHSLKQAFVMALLPALVLYFGVEKLIPEEILESTMYEFAVTGYQAYALSVIPAAITTNFIVMFMIRNWRLFANILQFLRSFLFIGIYIRIGEPLDIFWCWLFAECATLIVLAVGIMIFLKKRMAVENYFEVYDRNEEMNFDKVKEFAGDEVVAFIQEKIKVLKENSDTGKNDLTMINLLKEETGFKLTIRSMGKYFDYGKIFEDCKCTFTLGMNNLYVTLNKEVH